MLHFNGRRFGQSGGHQRRGVWMPMITMLILAFAALYIVPTPVATVALPVVLGGQIAMIWFVADRSVRGLPATPLTLPLGLLLVVTLISGARVQFYGSEMRVITIGAYVATYFFFYLYVSETKLTESVTTSGWVIMAAILTLNLCRVQGLMTIIEGNNNILASILLLHLPFGSRIEDTRTRAAWFVLGSVAMLSTQSRGGLLGLFWAMASLYRLDRRLLALGTVAVLPVAMLWQWDNTMIRLRYWLAAAQAFLSQPLLGIGPANCLAFISPRVGHNCPHAHNIFLTIAAEMGVVGLAVFCWLVWQVWRHHRPGPAWAALVGFFIHSMVDDPIWFWSPGFGVMSLLAIVMRENDE
jgi:hypothetical protein